MNPEQNLLSRVRELGKETHPAKFGCSPSLSRSDY